MLMRMVTDGGVVEMGKFSNPVSCQRGLVGMTQQVVDRNYPIRYLPR